MSETAVGDSISIPIQLLIAGASAVFTVGVAYAMVRAKIANLRESLNGALDSAKENRRLVDVHTTELYQQKAVDARLESEAKLLEKAINTRLIMLERTAQQNEDALERMVTRELFQSETRAQNRTLGDIQQRIARSVSPAGGIPRAVPIPIEIEEPQDDKRLPPMRRRLPSRPAE